MRALRKLLALALLAVFGLPFVTPLLAFAASGDSSLPACCRRVGRHHCAMLQATQTKAASATPEFNSPLQKCPFAPATTSPLHDSRVALPPSRVSFDRPLAARTGNAQATAWMRVVRLRSRYKRGPPEAALL